MKKIRQNIFNNNRLFFLSCHGFARNVLKIKQENLSGYNKSYSKYSLDKKITKDEVIKTQKSIPSYLKKEFDNTVLKSDWAHKTIDKDTLFSENFKANKHYDQKNLDYETLKRAPKPGQQMKLSQNKNFQKKPKKEFLLKQKREKKNIEFEQKTFSLLSKEDRKLLDNKDWSVDRHNLEFIKIEKERLKNEIVVAKKEKLIEKKMFFNKENFAHDFLLPERLSKRLAKLGVCSRRYAEKMIEQGVIYVDGKKVDSNVPVTAKSDIRVYTNKGYQIPQKEDARMWVFYKPRGYVCSKKDERVRLLLIKIIRKDILFSKFLKTSVSVSMSFQ